MPSPEVPNPESDEPISPPDQGESGTQEVLNLHKQEIANGIQAAQDATPHHPSPSERLRAKDFFNSLPY